MKPLPLAVHTAAEVRALDRHAIDDLHIPSYTLMTQAGEAAVLALRSCWPSKQRIVVICGPGNNGGDGYVAARLARSMRIDVSLISLVDPAKLRGDARRAHDDFVAAGGIVQPWSEDCLANAEVVIDAIFGTGLSRSLDAAMIERIHAINDCGAPILSLDIPSGLDADTGAVWGAAIMAERTLSFIGLKLGFYLGEGPNHTGIVLFDDLDLPAGATEFIAPSALRIDENAVAQLLPRRRRTTHKGQQGSVLVIGGGIGMAGAARMAGEAALRAGAGLVTVATWPENVASITASRPELMCRGVEGASELAPMIERADVLAIGPGLGTGEWGRALLDIALESDKPTVIDADALNLLAQEPCANCKWILTPHPGEAGRLLGIGTADVQSNRLQAARDIAARYGGTVVLKGAGTLVVSGDSLPYICDQGNPGMASPGMGDVLTGVIAGIAAQTADLPGAARAGVLVHAMAGDMAARRGERGLLATDLFGYLPTCVNPAQRF
ncbi:NAD(P)H-hydrate dehydratase [Steroidobacter sp. S1-65]|uniref:Bifunctional NAD(P)H-hydrate repair enzyme n=1 Tax=Steroidobacter gossypii TaxID=2805490 RepID=A0ABS1X6A7_9GAMM|nr:NAD(P)H-hydrate dehydratase [Steroidobacter gossypii]MBM0108756.1 NAD(P)H-hydrate dehydratase [Steroidobacter gossypii]